jgi:hypothetical protein
VDFVGYFLSGHYPKREEVEQWLPRATFFVEETDMVLPGWIWPFAVSILGLLIVVALIFFATRSK